MNELTTVPEGSIFRREQIELIKQTVCKGASDLEFRLFMEDCNNRGLNPLARQIFSVQRREKRGDQWITTRSTQVSIDGFRLIAERSGQYAGQLAPEWCGPDGKWRDVWLDREPPAAARIGVLRKDFEKPCVAVAVYEDYVQTNKDGAPISLWARMPRVMLSKCAEALALRKAFPQELSGLYTSDEMMQAAQQEGGAAMAMKPLAQDLNDEIPDFADGPEPSAEGAAAVAAAPATGGALTPYGLKLQLLYSVARAEAMKGDAALQAWFKTRTKEEKEELRKIKAELVTLYPK